MAIRNVVVLGGSYSGARAAELLSKTLPSTHRVVLIDRQSHFNHLYLFPRVGVIGESHKVFIPFTGVLASAAEPPPATLPNISSSNENGTDSTSSSSSSVNSFKKSSQSSLFVNAGVVEIGEGVLKVDRDLDEGFEQDEDEETDSVRQVLKDEGIISENRSAPRTALRTIQWDYLIYALGCTLPAPLVSPSLTKSDGVTFLESQRSRFAQSKSILIVGGGALGIQYATDLADLFNNPENSDLRPKETIEGRKKITLVHSRDRFLPLYKQEVHDEVVRRLEELGVEIVFGERLQLPTVEEEENAPQGLVRTVRTSQGKEIEYDLLLRCTGQKPNSELMKSFIPTSIDSHGYVKVKPTMQISSAPSHLSCAARIYPIGDVAAAGVIKAGHTGWNQAGVVVQNIMNSILCEKKKDGEEEYLVEYEKSVPQIKVTLGLRHSVSELLPSMEAKETIVSTQSDAPIDGHWKVLWSRMGVSSADPYI